MFGSKFALEDKSIYVYRSFFWVLTTLAFLVGVVAFSMYVYYSNYEAERVNAKLSVQYETYKGSLNAKHQAQYNSDKKRTATTENEPGEEEKEIELLFDKIVANINNYASEAGEDPVDRDKFASYLKREIPSVVDEENTFVHVLRDLEKATSKLAEDRKSMTRYAITDTRRIYARNFVDWYFATFAKKKAEIDRINQKNKIEAAVNRASAYVYYVASGVALAIFCVFLIFLVLIRIDDGIRKIASRLVKEEKQPSELITP